MNLAFWRVCSKTALVCVEVGGLLLLLLLAGAGFLAWKVSKGPVDLAFAKPYIQQALSSPDQGYDVKLGSVMLAWPDREGPLRLSLKDASLHETGVAAPVLNIARTDLSFSYPHLLLGKIRPVSIVLRRPAVLLVKDENGYNFFIQDSEEPQAITDKPAIKIDERIAKIVDAMDNPALRDGPLAVLKRVEIKNARVLIRDNTRQLSWYLTDLDFALRDEDDEISAFFSIAMSDKTDLESDFSAFLTYRRNSRDFAFSTDLKDFNPVVLSKLLPEDFQTGNNDLILNGKITALFDRTLALQSASVDISIPEGVIDYPKEFKAPIPVKDGRIQVAYDGTAKIFDISRISATISDIPIIGQGKVALTPEQITAPMIFRTSGDTPLSAMAPVFPNSERDGDAAKWMLDLMSGGVYRDVVLNTEIVALPDKENTAEKGWTVDVQKTVLNFAFDGVDVQYHETLPPAKDTKGSGTLDVDADTLTIKGERGTIGGVKSDKVDMVFNDIMVSGGGSASIAFNAAGPIVDAFDFISREPISMGDNFGFDTKNVKGDIKMSAQVDFPLAKDAPRDAFKVKIDATLSNVTIPGVVEGMTLSGGPLALKVGDGSFSVSGNGKLDGRDIALNWHEYFDSTGQPYAAQVKAQIVADKDLRHKFGVMLDEYMTGTVAADVTYTEFANDTSSLDMTGDLNTLLLHIKPFQFEKPAGVSGKISLKGKLEKGELKRIEDLNLETTGLSVRGAELSFGPLGGKKTELLSGKLPNAVIGKTNVSVNFEVTPQNILKVSATGPQFDAGPFMAGDKTKKPDAPAETKPPQQPMMISLSADKILTVKEQSVEKAKVYLETNAGGDITRLEMDARAGTGDIYLRFKPDDTGKRTFRLEASDAGATLLASGLYDNVRGGKIIVYGEPKGNNLNGDLAGTAQMENFRVVKAPALASLLSIMSLSGVGELLNNEGLAFSKLESNFEWRFRDGGNLLVVDDGRTSGSSIGLTFKGTVNQATNTTDIWGTIIPMTEINSVLKSIPLVGELLTGGSGLIAATYTMKGPSDAPRVAINPLSVLTPGFLRTILFENGFKSAAPDNEPKPKTP